MVESVTRKAGWGAVLGTLALWWSACAVAAPNNADVQRQPAVALNRAQKDAARKPREQTPARPQDRKSAVTPKTTAYRPYLPRFPAATPKQWIFEIEEAGVAPWSGKPLLKSLEKHGLPTEDNDKSKLYGGHAKWLAEWDYTYSKIPPGGRIGDGTIRDARDCVGPLAGCYPHPPKTRGEALARLKLYWDNHRPDLRPDDHLVSVTGHYFFQHYGAAWGAKTVMSEVGENIGSTQAHIAFTRGAARQYGKGWGIDVSAWYRGRINDYSGKYVWGAASCATCGHSASLLERTYFASYMAGAEHLRTEAASVIFFAGDNPEADGTFPLSPLGVAAQRFHGFTKAVGDRGVPVVPIVIVLGQSHGLGPDSFAKGLAWDCFDENPDERWTRLLFNALWPGSFEQPRDESEFLVGSPVGDTVDVLLETASPTVLDQYQVVVLSGEVTPTPALVAGLTTTVSNGGTLVLSDSRSHGRVLAAMQAANTNQRPALGLDPKDVTQLSFSSGKVIVVHQETAIPDVLAALARRFLPISVNGHVQWMLNKTADGFIVTLINNRGVTKLPSEPATIDPQETQTATVALKSGLPSGVRTIRSAHAPRIGNRSFTVTVAPGDIAVIEFKVAPQVAN